MVVRFPFVSDDDDTEALLQSVCKTTSIPVFVIKSMHVNSILWFSAVQYGKKKKKKKKSHCHYFDKLCYKIHSEWEFGFFLHFHCGGKRNNLDDVLESRTSLQYLSMMLFLSKHVSCCDVGFALIIAIMMNYAALIWFVRMLLCMVGKFDLPLE